MPGTFRSEGTRPSATSVLELREIPTIKRAVSPDGRVNSISFFLQIPVTDPAKVDTERVGQFIALLNQQIVEIARLSPMQELLTVGQRSGRAG
jgi:hypothetical protein